LYDGTVAEDYYRAMQVESRFDAPENLPQAAMSSGQLLALVDALRCGTLNEKPQELVQTLRVGILALTGR
jgi:hypothetical protein